MALAGRLTFEFPDGREPIKFGFVLATEDEDLLRQYVAATKDLMDSVRRAGGLSTQLNMSFRRDEGIVYTTTEPTDDQRAIILHRLRPLILSREGASFDRACAIVRRSSEHEFLVTYLRRLRDLYSGKDFRELVVISRNDIILNSETAFHHWLNGFEYHRDAERAALVAEKGDPLPFDVVRPSFMVMLGEKLKAINLLADMVSKMIERSDSGA